MRDGSAWGLHPDRLYSNLTFYHNQYICVFLCMPAKDFFAYPGGSVMIKKPVSENRTLYLEELSGIHMSAERMDSVISFMEYADLASLRVIKDTDILYFRNMYLKKTGLWDRLAFFQDALEEARNWSVRKDAEVLLAFYTSALPFTVFAKRACNYLAAHGVASPEEIGYPVRASLEKYLQAISYVCIPSVLSAVDRMKLEAMRRDYERRKMPLQKSYPQKDELFLLYDAGYPQAKILYPTSDKASLYYDLTVLSSNRIRAQFRELLFFALDLPIEPLKLRSYYIQPLRLLYETA